MSVCDQLLRYAALFLCLFRVVCCYSNFEALSRLYVLFPTLNELDSLFELNGEGEKVYVAQSIKS